MATTPQPKHQPLGTPTPDLYGPQPNPGTLAEGITGRHGSPEHMHSEQSGWLVELAQAAKDDPENVAKLAAVVQELVRMVIHFDIKSDSRGQLR